MAEQLASDERTQLERDADRLDCDLYRLLGRVEALYDRHKKYHDQRKYLSESLRGLRSARVGLRCLMHKDDRAATI